MSPIVYRCLYCTVTFTNPSNDAIAVTDLVKHMNMNHREMFSPDPNAIPVEATDA